MLDNNGNVVAPPSIPDNKDYDYVNIYFDPTKFNKAEVLTALGKRTDLTNKEVIFKDVPFDANDNPDPSGSSEMIIGFGTYQ